MAGTASALVDTATGMVTDMAMVGMVMDMVATVDMAMAMVDMATDSDTAIIITSDRRKEAQRRKSKVFATRGACQLGNPWSLGSAPSLPVDHFN